VLFWFAEFAVTPIDAASETFLIHNELAYYQQRDLPMQGWWTYVVVDDIAPNIPLSPDFPLTPLATIMPVIMNTLQLSPSPSS
jgi:hypothetical protein